MTMYYPIPNTKSRIPGKQNPIQWEDYKDPFVIVAKYHLKANARNWIKSSD